MILDDALRAFLQGSKVVDKHGAPIMVFHGTKGDVPFFDGALSDSSSKTGCPSSSFFFTDSVDVAESYTVRWQGDFSRTYHDGAAIMPLYLSIKNPLRISAKGDDWRNVEYKGNWISTNDLAQLAQDAGRYDGVIISRVRDKGVGSVTTKLSTTYICFAPEQIKSALGDRVFDPCSPFVCSKSPSEQALDNFRLCLHARAKHHPELASIDRDALRLKEMQVYTAPMSDAQRRDFFIQAMRNELGYFHSMAVNHVDGVLCSGDEAPFDRLFEDLGKDWTLAGFAMPCATATQALPSTCVPTAPKTAPGHLSNEPQTAFEF